MYYKWAQRQIDFKDGAQLFVNPGLDAEFLFGRGWSYGNELYLEKKTGRTIGWAGYTLPQGRYLAQDVFGAEPLPVPLYPDRNSYRLAPYHRLDLSLVWKMKPTRWFRESDVTFSVYNAYSRRNPYFVFFDRENDPQTGQARRFVARQVSLFPIIPSATCNFKF